MQQNFGGEERRNKKAAQPFPGPVEHNIETFLFEPLQADNITEEGERGIER